MLLLRQVYGWNITVTVVVLNRCVILHNINPFRNIMRNVKKFIQGGILMERKTVKPIVSRKHSWEKDERGKIDIFAYENGYHNGPCCTICKSSFCMHCEPDYDNTLCKPHYVCPECGTALSEEHKEKYCMECGVKFDWSEALSQEEIELQAEIQDARSRFKEKFPNREEIAKLIEREPKYKRVRLFNSSCRLLVLKPDIKVSSVNELKMALLDLDLL